MEAIAETAHPIQLILGYESPDMATILPEPVVFMFRKASISLLMNSWDTVLVAILANVHICASVNGWEFDRLPI